MERNKQAFDFSRTDPAEIAKAATEVVQTKFNQKNCKFFVTIDDGLRSIMVDKDAMVTVLVNLLDNAYKYTNDDKRIELKVSGEDDYICFSVKDNGIGMTRRDTKKIFSRFYQIDQSLARTSEGCGLGLSIVKFIVDAHKGKVTVESKLGISSEFKVIIPVCRN
jgi:signal transduction histidine kinase